MIWFLLIVLAAADSAGAPPTTAPSRKLPTETSRYNQGNAPGRYRDANKKIKRFALKRADVPIFDGGGRAFGRVREPVMLNVGAFKRMDLDGTPGKEPYGWAWATDAGSGWIALDALVDPPTVQIDDARNPKPPRESDVPLTIDATRGTERLKNLRHVNSEGEIPTGGGNKGEHYAGRNPGPGDFVYLLFAVPNVQRGGVAKDSIPDGEKFVQALDEEGNLITETMTMYRDNDFNQPVQVSFLYGRAQDGDVYGWLARANVGER